MARKAEVMVANGEGLSVADAAAAKKVVAAAGAAAMEQVVTAAAAKGEEADVEVARAGISVVAVAIVAKGVEEMVVAAGTVEVEASVALQVVWLAIWRVAEGMVGVVMAMVARVQGAVNSAEDARAWEVGSSVG